MVMSEFKCFQGFLLHLRLADATMSNSDIFNSNPYEGHINLSPLEADVLWEYAKLSQHVKEVRDGISVRRTVVIMTQVEQCVSRS